MMKRTVMVEIYVDTETDAEAVHLVEGMMGQSEIGDESFLVLGVKHIETGPSIGGIIQGTFEDA